MILDTSFLIDLLRGKDPKVKEKSLQLDNRFEVRTIVSITVLELWRGALLSLDQDNEKRKVNELLESINILSFNEKDAKRAAEIEANLKNTGDIIDLEDIMIAGVAQSRDETIITKNIKHFSKIEGLKIEDY